MGKLLEEFDAELLKRFKADFKSSFSLYQEMKDSALIMNSLEKNARLYTELRAFINTHKEDIKERYPHEPQLLSILHQSLKTFEDYWNFSFEEISHFKNSTIRDELMAQNFIWLAEHVYPDKKITLLLKSVIISFINKANRDRFLFEIFISIKLFETLIHFLQCFYLMHVFP